MPFEAPQNPEVFIDTMQLNPEDAAEAILAKVRELGYI